MHRRINSLSRLSVVRQGNKCVGKLEEPVIPFTSLLCIVCKSNCFVYKPDYYAPAAGHAGWAGAEGGLCRDLCTTYKVVSIRQSYYILLYIVKE